jgi:hypothetical protein
LDLAGTEASVVQVRAEAKDCLDIDALIRVGAVELSLALSAARQIYGSTFNPRSWAYWNSKMGRYPPPPLPKRDFGEKAAN